MRQPAPLGKTGLSIIIAVLAVSGVAGAVIAVFGLFDSIAYSLLWRIFVADLYLLASLTARHLWLQRAAWISIAVALLAGIVNAFWKITPDYRRAEGSTSYTVGDTASGWSPWFGIVGDIEAAAHILTIALLVLCFLSNAYRWLSNNRVLRNVYVFNVAMVLCFALLAMGNAIDSSVRWNLFVNSGPLMTGIAILVVTGCAILSIAATVFRAGSKHTFDTAPLFESTQVSAAVAASKPVSSAGKLAGLNEAELRTLIREVVVEVLAEREHAALQPGWQPEPGQRDEPKQQSGPEQ